LAVQSGGRKGGRVAGLAGDPELADELPEGVIGVAEALGDCDLGLTVEEDGSEGFVLTLGGTGGLRKETSGRSIGHGRHSGCEVPFPGN
jgi:hypothetical protein